jgi:hypothetical protein
MAAYRYHEMPKMAKCFPPSHISKNSSEKLTLYRLRMAGHFGSSDIRLMHSMSAKSWN